MRDGAHDSRVRHKAYDHMPHKSSRAVHRSRDCAGLEHDARVPLSEDLTTAKHGSTH